MKRIISVIISLVLVISLAGCGKASLKPELSVAQMKAICELATVECYYHNVAKISEKNTEGFLWWTKDTHFWIEYSGVVTLGIDISKVKIDVNGTDVTITLPEAEVFDCDIEVLDKDSWIVDKDSAKITAEDETKGIAKAQQDMYETAEGNTALLANAQLRAQTLLEQYIKNIGNISGVEYSIEWKYTENTPPELPAE